VAFQQKYGLGKMMKGNKVAKGNALSLISIGLIPCYLCYPSFRWIYRYINNTLYIGRAFFWVARVAR
jgi:hypothetical protein